VGIDGVATPELKKIVRSTFGEYFTNKNLAETLSTLREQIHPNALGGVIGGPKGCFDLVFEKHLSSAKDMAALLGSCYSEGFLTQEQAEEAVLQFLNNLDDTIIDSPKASETGSEIIAACILLGVVDLGLIGRVLSGGADGNMFAESPRRSTFIAHLLAAYVKKSNGMSTEEELAAMVASSGIDLPAIVAALYREDVEMEPGAQATAEGENAAQAAFFAKHDKIAFLFR
jgi:hypothetical protein